VEIISGPAPDALRDLPAPDRVFIGGSGGALADVLALVNGKMQSGIVVINAVTLETLNDALAGLQDNGFSVEVSEISVSRSKIVAGKRHMGALNPVFIMGEMNSPVNRIGDKKAKSSRKADALPAAFIAKWSFNIIVTTRETGRTYDFCRYKRVEGEIKRLCR
jgi:hypothetical protein